MFRIGTFKRGEGKSKEVEVSLKDAARKAMSAYQKEVDDAG